MGKFSDLFRKSSDKAKDSGAGSNSSNPYADAQPAPAADPYAANLYYPAPRPGNSSRASPHPSEGPHGPSRTSTWESNKTPPPGYPKDQIGALGGFGQNRFNQPASQKPFAQRPGGYGNLDADDRSSFARYTSTSNESPDQGSQQPGAWNGGPTGGLPPQEMTEQERLDWEVSQTKSQIKYYRNETEATQDRIISKFEHILSTQDAQLETLYRQGERINNIDNHVGKTGHLAVKATAAANEVESSAKMGGFIGESQRDKKRAALADAAAQREMQYRQEIMQEDAKWQAKHDALERESAARKRVLGNVLSEQERAQARKQFMFEEDDDEEAVAQEKRIEDKSEKMLGYAHLVRQKAEHTNIEIQRQNERLEKISQRADVVMDNVGRGQRRLDALLAKK